MKLNDEFTMKTNDRWPSSTGTVIATSIENPTGVFVSLLSDNAILERLLLPLPSVGRNNFSILQSVHFESSEDGWIVRCNNRAKMVDENDIQVDTLPLQDQRMLQINERKKQYRLLVEEINNNSRLFHNYIVLTNIEIQIGRADDNDIICKNKLASRHHAVLIFDGKTWTLQDCKSTHGTYVNDTRIESISLKMGDSIIIPGLRIVVGCGFISIADKNNRLILNQQKLRRIEETSQVFSRASSSIGRMSGELFNRFPRSRVACDPHNIEIEAPPVSMNGEQLPLLMRLGSSMIMGSRAALTGNMAMVAGSVFLPFLSQQYTKEEKEEYEKKRTERYREYLDAKWNEILNEKEREETALIVNYPALSDVLEYTNQRKKLWERRKTDDDFLTLRVGAGNVPMAAEIEYPKRRFELEDDPLLDEMYDLAERKIELENVPILLNLKRDTIWGVLGNRAAVLSFAKSILMRLSLLYSYDEVKIVVLAESDEVEQMEFLRFLPHVWDDQRIIRFVATEEADTYQISEHLAKVLEQDLKKTRPIEEILDDHPYYIVFALNKRLFEGMEVLKTAMQQNETCGVSVIACFEDLPKECSVLITLDDLNQQENSNIITYLKEIDKVDDRFHLDTYEDKIANRAMRTLANIELKVLSQANALPQSYSFLEMYSVGRIEHLNILKRWQDNDPTKSLSVPIGIGTNGVLFSLDLHQKYHGPHGLVAGTTGSGKSEFLITYILSLAVNFHPEEVAFLLIDYKGGGLAGAFDDPRNGIHLPHLIGTITNLDGSAIARSLVCIQSEMIRRQVVFNEAKSATGEGTMDIYLYQKLYRKKVVNEPMPHLFIISDEFAELKQQQPEFLEALVSIARVGRSLGVHLILATQKPAGIVTDQIVSNSKFKVCLKVQDRADSMDMLKRPDACELRETGRFYLQVGSNELFAMGQAAWCGTDYEPQNTMPTKHDDSVSIIDNIGASIVKVSPETAKSSTGQSQLVAIVKALSDLATAQGLHPQALWLPPLPEKIDISSFVQSDQGKSEDISYACGMLDDPTSLSQFPLVLDFTTSGNWLVVGEPRTGKTTFVQSLLYSLANNYAPEKVHFYALDYSGRLLKLFNKLPHCGVILTEEDDNILDSFFELISAIANERKKLFSELEVDSFETACQIKPIPLILVVIDNLAGMTNSKIGQKHLDFLQTYIKNWSGYGIRFIITISHLNEASMRIKQELTNRIALHLRDKYEFGEALNQRISYVPADKKGRGLYIQCGKALELQLAMFAADLPEKERIATLKQRIGDICERMAGHEIAPRLKTVSKDQTYEQFCHGFRLGRIPLGYSLDEGTAVALPLKQFTELSLYFGNPDSVVPVLDNIIFAAKRENSTVVFMKHADESCADDLRKDIEFHIFDANPSGVEMIANTILSKVGERYNAYKEYCEINGLKVEKIESIVPDYDAMKDIFSPLMIIYERFIDVTRAAKDSPSLFHNYETIFTLAKRYRIFIIACVHPDDNLLLNGAPIYDIFNREKLAMLFGGNLNRQKIVTVPYGKGKPDSTDAYNKCLMSYRGGIYPVFMPCGVFKQRILPEDDRPIFKQA